jgi:hypothetical protein
MVIIARRPFSGRSRLPAPRCKGATRLSPKLGAIALAPMVEGGSRF